MPVGNTRRKQVSLVPFHLVPSLLVARSVVRVQWSSLVLGVRDLVLSVPTRVCMVSSLKKPLSWQNCEVTEMKKEKAMQALSKRTITVGQLKSFRNCQYNRKEMNLQTSFYQEFWNKRRRQSVWSQKVANTYATLLSWLGRDVDGKICLDITALEKQIKRKITYRNWR